MHSGEPASVWQLPETRTSFGNAEFTTIAFHQCRFGVDRAKPTRIFTDVMGFKDEGHVGWPTFDAAGYYLGPLPRSCGHRHKEKTIGQNGKGGFNISHTAAYPPQMCEWIARVAFEDWLKSPRSQGVDPAFGTGNSSAARPGPEQRSRTNAPNNNAANPECSSAVYRYLFF